MASLKSKHAHLDAEKNLLDGDCRPPVFFFVQKRETNGACNRPKEKRHIMHLFPMSSEASEQANECKGANKLNEQSGASE